VKYKYMCKPLHARPIHAEPIRSIANHTTLRFCALKKNGVSKNKEYLGADAIKG